MPRLGLGHGHRWTTPKALRIYEGGNAECCCFLATLKRIHIRLMIEEQHKRSADSYPLDKPAEGRDAGVVEIDHDE